MKLEHLQEQQLDEGFREKALAAIAAAGLTFGSFAKADTLPDLFAYTDDAGETQVVLDYNDVPKGKMARIVKYEDVFGKMDVDEMAEAYIKACTPGAIFLFHDGGSRRRRGTHWRASHGRLTEEQHSSHDVSGRGSLRRLRECHAFTHPRVGPRRAQRPAPWRQDRGSLVARNQRHRRH